MADQPTTTAKDDAPEEDPQLSPGVIIGVVAALIVITVLIFTVFGGSDDDGAGGSTASPVEPAPIGTFAPGPGPGPTTTTAAGPKAVTGLPSGAPTDDFNRPDDETTIGAGWEEIGTWGILDNRLANIVEGDEATREFALRDLGAGDGTVAAVVIESAEGTGLVFRFKDAKNYWMLTPAPKYGTWVLNKYTNGTATLVGNSGLASSAENTAVVVELAGPEITVKVDGKEVAQFTDPYLATATKVGFASGGFGAQRARWDDFYAID